MTLDQAIELALDHHRAGRLAEAEALYWQILAADPQQAEALHHLGIIAHQVGRNDLAVDLISQAIAKLPTTATFHTHLGEAYRALGRLDEAIASYRRSIALHSGSAEAHSNLANALKDEGDVGEAIAEYRRAVELKPSWAGAHSNLLLALHYGNHSQPEDVFTEHRRWNDVHAEPLAPPSVAHPNPRDPARPLRIGYVSPDFREHSVAFFIEGILASHRAPDVEVVCYSDVAREDAYSLRLRSCVKHWRTIAGMHDEEAARLIRQDGIDVLVDLAGHTANHRLLVFARKPAPVQVSYLGYCATTGLRAMDYRLTDALADPPGATEHLYSERLMRLPETAWCYRALQAAPPVEPLPLLGRGHVTFGCFNARTKMTDELLCLWAGLLLEVPGSRLLLKNLALGTASVASRMRAIFADAGVAPDRLEIIGPVPAVADHLAWYGRVDIALDTFPYGGTATTCEALWMGVPVVSWAGSVHASRVGASLLNSVGLPELVAAGPAEYVETAVKLAADVPRLTAIRTTLREMMANSPLMDAQRFTAALEDCYRRMWRAWCEEGR